ncbi:MAG: 50S ribosomal protein L11 methyltransferase [Alistipes sp.]|nr:50S ribosomal protein L11 methyltransferase [Alistipes sp.]
MQYVELNINVKDEEQADILTAMLSDYPFEAFESDASSLRAYIPTTEHELCRRQVSTLLEEWDISDYAFSEVEQQNWNQQWESDFEPVDVEGATPIRIRAPHHEAKEGAVDVVIAPRMSFGTGHHTTTALMSQTIAELSLKGRGLDMGCGTGVLAIVALKCGAEKMVCVDIDDWACDSCRDSVSLSGVEHKVEVRCGSTDVLRREQFDFVLANINRNILQMMLPHFAQRISEGGQLLMSGFLGEDIVHITASALECGFAVEQVKERDEWVVMVCRKE